MAGLNHQADMFLPDYSVRISHRAKYLRLQFRHDGELEVVLPKRVSAKHIPGFVHENLAWIQRTRSKLSLAVQPLPMQIPKTIELTALGETWAVHIRARPDNGGNVSVQQVSDQQTLLIVSAASDSAQQIRQVHGKLQSWLRQRAQQFLPAKLTEVARHTGITFNKVTIRSQRTRWGSCSSQGNINLNDRLMFLPVKQVEYLLIHELCHRRHMNHSRAYWKLVEKHCPDYRRLDRALSGAFRELPAWTTTRNM